MQAITTRYHGPTNTRGSRVSARCQAGRVTLNWDDALNQDQNHDRAALALARKLGWLEKRSHAVDLVRGGLPDGRGNVYVFWHGGAFGELVWSNRS